MVAVTPFRALRYNLAAVGDLSAVVAPPYDVIAPPQQEQLYGASPHNVVRLILGKELPTDTPADNRYTRARRDFDAWCAGQVLRRDAEPSFTLIEHSFTAHGARARRLGFLGLLRLEEDGTGGPGVFRHEATLEAPKADRRRLLEAIPANLSPIFCIYPDAGATLQAFLEGLCRRLTPAAHATLGVERVQVRVVREADAIRRIQERLAGVSVLIADGHHRHEVARATRQRYGFVMTYFVSMEDPALKVRPIHRLVRVEPSGGLKGLRGFCTLEPAKDLDELLTWLEAPAPGRFGCCARSTLWQVTVSKERLARWLKESPLPPAVAGLDVSVLHGRLLPALGLRDDQLTYTADAAEALAEVNTGPGGMAWLLRGIPVEQVYSIASQGFTLPPKSTYFYPKVLSGLAFNPFDSIER